MKAGGPGSSISPRFQQGCTDSKIQPPAERWAPSGPSAARSSRRGQNPPTKATCAPRHYTGCSVRRHRRFWHVLRACFGTGAHILFPHAGPASSALPRGEGTRSAGPGGMRGGGTCHGTARPRGLRCWHLALLGQSWASGWGWHGGVLVHEDAGLRGETEGFDFFIFRWERLF